MKKFQNTRSLKKLGPWKFEGKFILFFTSFVNGRLVCLMLDTLFLSSFSMDEKVIFRHKSTLRIQNNC